MTQNVEYDNNLKWAMWEKQSKNKWVTYYGWAIKIDSEEFWVSMFPIKDWKTQMSVNNKKNTWFDNAIKVNIEEAKWKNDLVYYRWVLNYNDKIYVISIFENTKAWDNEKAPKYNILIREDNVNWETSWDNNWNEVISEPDKIPF